MTTQRRNVNDPALVVFDMAGTTVRDAGQVADALTAACREHGIEITAPQLSQLRGASKREALLRLVPQGPDRAGRAERVYADFRERLLRGFARGVDPIDGAGRIFERLRGRGIRVALATGFDRALVAVLLRSLGWQEGAVDAVVCGDEVPRGRPAPYLIFRAMEATGTLGVHEVATVGDTQLDLEAGRNAGVRWNIGVLSGAHDRRRLERSPHTHLLASIAELADLWPGGDA